MWSTITEDDWARVVKRDGEEIGVFLSNSDKSSYDPRKVRFLLPLAAKAGVYSLDADCSIRTARRKYDTYSYVWIFTGSGVYE